MKDLIKKVLKEYVELNELDRTSHYIDRLRQRLEGNVKFPIMLATPTKGGLDTQEVGTYTLKEMDRLKIMDHLELLERVDFPDDGSYGVKIFQFNIETTDIETKFFRDRDHEIEIRKGLLMDKLNLYISDPETESTGDILFGIVKQQKLITALFARSYNLEQKYSHFDGIFDMDQVWAMRDKQRFNRS